MEGEGLVDIQPPKRQPINIMPYPQITLFFGGVGGMPAVYYFTQSFWIRESNPLDP